MMLSKQSSLGAALVAFVLGLLVTLLSPLFESALDSDPLSTNAAMLAPKYSPSVATPPPDHNYVPDSRKDFDTLPPQTTTVTPSENVTQLVTPPPTIRKPKTAVQPLKHAPVPTPVATSSVAERVVSYAMTKLGKPYVWGATGPNAFDCSGLVQAAFKAAGISLPRTTKTIIGRGKAVSRNALQRGDLVWTSSGHMGIYVGDNKIIHAPQTGDVVKVSTIWAFYAARRI